MTQATLVRLSAPPQEPPEQNILKLTTAPVVDELGPMVARLEELDARWERFVDGLAEAFTSPAVKYETAKRNPERRQTLDNHARALKALKARGIPASVTGPRLKLTVKQEGRRDAEAFALRYLQENSAHPVCVKVIRELDEAEALRKTIESRTQPAWLHD